MAKEMRLPAELQTIETAQFPNPLTASRVEGVEAKMLYRERSTDTSVRSTLRDAHILKL